jgi:hypothetical protein
MKHLLTSIVCSLALASTAAFAANKAAPEMTKTAASAPAAGASGAKTAQQEKMTQCNADAGDKKGDERKAFMKTCLSNKPMTQQEKMTYCNKQATDKKGDERKAFMSQCLSK